MDAIHAGISQFGDKLFGKHVVFLRQRLRRSAGRICNDHRNVATNGSITEGDNFAARRADVVISDDNIHRNVAKLTRHVTCVSCLQGGVGKTLTRTVSRDEVLEDRKTVAEGRQNRTLNNFTGRLSHQTAGSAKLFDLGFITTSTGVHHGEDRVDNPAMGVTWVTLLDASHTRGTRECGIHGLGNLVCRSVPNFNDLITAFFFRDRSIRNVAVTFCNTVGSFAHDLFLFLREDHVVHADRDTRTGSDTEAGLLECIKDRD